METVRADLAAEGVGYLDIRDYKRAQWAYEQSHPAAPFMQWLKIAGYVSFDADDVRVQSSGGGHINIPATKLAWEEITRISTELNRWDGVESAACDQFGAFLLVELGREVSTAVARWPMEERPHKIESMRCGGCGMLTLTYRPPRWEGDAIRVDCACGYVLEDDGFSWAVTMIQKEEDERRKKERKCTTGT
jgi:hypothetical protein